MPNSLLNATLIFAVLGDRRLDGSADGNISANLGDWQSRSRPCMDLCERARFDPRSRIAARLNASQRRCGRRICRRVMATAAWVTAVEQDRLSADRLTKSPLQQIFYRE
jgi:hypothetical protein